MKLCKKAQVPTQIMTYVLAAILFGLIMIFGYNIVVSMRASSESVAMVQFKTQLEGDIKKMAQETGRTTRTFEYFSPANFKEVCFADSSSIGGSRAELNELLGKMNDRNFKCYKKHLIYFSMRANVQANMFFFPGTYNFDVGPIEVENKCTCIDIKGGRIILKMQGKGDRAKIVEETI